MSLGTLVALAIFTFVLSLIAIKGSMGARPGPALRTGFGSGLAWFMTATFIFLKFGVEISSIPDRGTWKNFIGTDNFQILVWTYLCGLIAVPVCYVAVRTIVPSRFSGDRSTSFLAMATITLFGTPVLYIATLVASLLLWRP